MKRNTKDQAAPVMDPSVKEVANPEAYEVATRNCWAVDTLVAEVQAIEPEATYEADSVDFSGANLAVTLANLSPSMTSALSLIAGDERVETAIAGGEEMTGHFYACFYEHPILKDTRDPFGLADALVVLTEDDDTEGIEA